MLIIPENLGIQNITAYVTRTQAIIAHADTGGNANIYRGVYTHPGNHATVQVVIKSARVSDLESGSRKISQRTQKNLLRELTVWYYLQRNPQNNILPLLGVVYIPSSKWLCSVSEYCQLSLEAYFKHPPEKPEYIRFLKEILAGLVHMHSFDPPIAHGDLKLANVLLGFDGNVKLCDFGQARFQNDQRGLASDASTTFESTHRFMSPELFQSTQKVRPTGYSDVWAYGCVALQLLSRLRPYHTIKNDYLIPNVILSGRVPSSKPERPHAPRCLNDYLWSIIEWCWRPLEYRPTTARLFDEFNRLIDSHLIDISSLTPDRMSLDFDGDMPPWPDGIADFSGQGLSPNRKLLCRGVRAEIWIHQETVVSDQVAPKYIIKAPSPPRRLSPRKTKLDPFQYLLRRVIRERYSIQHQNIVEMLGIDTSFGLYSGLVFEFCENLSLEAYKVKHFHDRYSLINYATQILEGLSHLHTFPTPIAHGDLNPSNIMVDAQGILKLALFSLSQIAANVPQTERAVPLASHAEIVRYFSPEMLSDVAIPSIKSDMWAYGCLVFWLFANQEPYHETSREQDVVALIQKGVLPSDAQLLREEAEIDGRFRQNSRKDWLFNGISDRAEKCWSSSGWPSASDFLQFLREFPNDTDEDTAAWMSGASNLSGTIIQPPILWIHGGSTSGLWRYSTSRSKPEQNMTSITINWTKASFKRGLFRFQTEAIIKFSMSGQSRSGSSHHIAAQSSIKHEIAILTQLQHSNICFLWGYEEDTFGSPSLPAIVTEFSPNGTLREYLNRRYDLNTPARLLLMKNVLKGVDYLHEHVTQGTIVHGNLNMDKSIVVDKNGVAKLRNFEFSFQYKHTESLYGVATLIRAPVLAPAPSRWHPPEMFVEESGSDWPLLTRYTDLWATGCLLVAIFSNLEPYSGIDLPAVFSRISDKEKPYSRDACAHQGVWAVAERLWGNSTMDRISASKALEEINEYMK
ncbi:tyrosine kinase domain protein [Rhizoctonia solani 123E]|uniref:Tyrosine kinase domain protein n=1 Tax=Rhizoctonia solani 123E TaxID=1423351 RepID=A0A074S1N9_9AGAM|nr:tyrosine kinase domain protein [Rhizoctonia solani 123E]